MLQYCSKLYSKVMAAMNESHVARDLLKLQQELIQSRERRSELRLKTAELKSEKNKLENEVRFPYQSNQSETSRVRSETLELKLKQILIVEQRKDAVQVLERLNKLIGGVREEIHQIQILTAEAQEEKRQIRNAIQSVKEDRICLQTEEKWKQKKVKEQLGTIKTLKDEIELEKCLNISIKALINNLDSRQRALSLDLNKKQQELENLRQNMETLMTKMGYAAARRKLLKSGQHKFRYAVAKGNVKLANANINSK